MWIITDKGFFSFVVDRKDPAYLWLRARVREDLARNFPDATIIEKPGADYYFRAKVLRTEVARVMSEQIMAADITGHFKDVAIQRSAVPTHGSRSQALYAFWNAMAACQPFAPYSRTPRPAPYKPTAKGLGRVTGVSVSDPFRYEEGYRGFHRGADITPISQHAEDLVGLDELSDAEWAAMTDAEKDRFYAEPTAAELRDLERHAELQSARTTPAVQTFDTTGPVPVRVNQPDERRAPKGGRKRRGKKGRWGFRL